MKKLLTGHSFKLIIVASVKVAILVFVFYFWNFGVKVENETYQFIMQLKLVLFFNFTDYILLQSYQIYTDDIITQKLLIIRAPWSII